MSSIEWRIVVPGDDEEAVRRRVLGFLEDADEYDVPNASESAAAGAFLILGYREMSDGDSNHQFSVDIGREKDQYPDSVLVVVSAPEEVLEETADLDDAPILWSFIEMTKDIYRVVSDDPVAAHGVAKEQGVLVLVTGETTPPTREYVSWMDIFPPEEVEQIGRDRLLSAPVAHREELEDGSIVTVLNHPLNTSPEPLAEFAAHIGLTSWTEAAL